MIRELITDNIAAIIKAFDAHDPGIESTGAYRCPCGWTGNPGDWEAHLADAIADALTTVTVQLPLIDSVPV